MLTPRQQQLLDFLKSRAETGAVGPSIAEMARALSLSSASSVHHLLVSLEKRGYIKRFANRARAIAILPGPSETRLPSATGWSATANIVGKIDLTIKLEVLRRNGPALSLPPEITATGQFFALRVQSRRIHHDKLRRGDICIFDRHRPPKPGDIVLIRPPNVDYGLLCSYIIRRAARIYEPIDPRSPHHCLSGTDIQALGTAVAVLRTL